MNKKSGGAMTGGSGSRVISAGCSLCYRRLRQGCNCATEADRPPTGVTEQGALLSTDGSATVPAWFCAPAGQCDVPAGCSACVARPGRGMCLPGRRRGPGGCLNLTLVVHNNYFKVQFSAYHGLFVVYFSVLYCIYYFLMFNIIYIYKLRN